jgi:hypothetical protein
MVSVPEVTGSARVMVVFSSLRDFSELQSAARREVEQADSKSTSKQTRWGFLKEPSWATEKLFERIRPDMRAGLPAAKIRGRCDVT